MKILIVFATTEGQTAKIAEFVLGRLTGMGHTVTLVSAETAPRLDVGSYDGVIAAGSIHAGQYQRSLLDWAKGAALALNGRPGLFLSVSLAAAGNDSDDWKGIERSAAQLSATTGWIPGRIVHVAGAFRFSEYDFFKSWAMRWIASQKGEQIPAGEDREYTDWDDLSALVSDWIETLAVPA